MASFNEPVVRCTDCQRLVFRTEIKEFGCCPDCGCKRFKNVVVMDDKEQQILIDKGHGDFLKLFKEVSG